jgi:hypothetical protein
LFPQTPGKAFDLVVFGGDRVLEGEARDLQLPMIESVLVDILRGRGCPRGNPSIPKVPLQSVGCIGRLIDGKLRVEPRSLFSSFC